MFCKFLQMDEGDSGKDFAHKREKGNGSVVVSATSLSFTLAQGDVLGIPHALGYGPSCQH